MKSLLWCAASPPETRARVLSLYRQILRSLNSPILELSLAARLAKKAEATKVESKNGEGGFGGEFALAPMICEDDECQSGYIHSHAI
ncbi:hypothetical protein EZV62_002185 [Acer yangbiense]|uniref:LYR motif containing domain-containing protein n=1 Tax=Acer yangbiense TaxID=1000413 RepID=A0A5C7IYS9_9ROSI|nr:hypothetical protein EZV62_002185 [Acer yangbiense]